VDQTVSDQVKWDSRCVGAMLSLGYRVFPFDAFDRNGELLIPDGVRFPADVATELGRVASNPLWADLYRTMSPLQHHHKCFMVGIGFVNEKLQIAIFKWAGTVSDANEAQYWADSYHGTVEATLHAYAGRSYLIDPRWRPAIEEARKYVPKYKEPSGEVSDIVTQLPGPDTPASVGAIEPLVVIPWLGLALDLFADLVSKATVRTKVLTTVLWYPTSVADLTYAGRWRPIHTNLQKGTFSGHRSAHAIWNPVGSPVIWTGASVAWKGPGLDMPHDPVQWCQALRPTANCTARPISGEDHGDVAQAAAP
jgi:hypothetical protein